MQCACSCREEETLFQLEGVWVRSFFSHRMTELISSAQAVRRLEFNEVGA